MAEETKELKNNENKSNQNPYYEGNQDSFTYAEEFCEKQEGKTK